MPPALDDPLRFVRGVGPVRAELLDRLSLRTALDMLLCLPRRHEDRRGTLPIRDISPGQKVTVAGVVAGLDNRRIRGRARSIFSAVIDDSTGSLEAVWFNQPYLSDVFALDDEVVLTGKVREYRGGFQLQSPEFEIVRRASEADDPPEAEPAEGAEELPPLSVARLVPFYGLTEGLTQRFMRKLAWRVARDYAELLPESIPAEVAERRQLTPLDHAVRRVHYPESPEDYATARRRLVFEELFVFSVGIALSRSRRMQESLARAVAVSAKVDERIRRRFPFMLTASQEKAIGEIVDDISRTRPMCRLLQGDVGSGKTAVALYAALAVVADGAQVAVMVPTEILAEQHFERFRAWLRGSRVNIRLITASNTPSEREEVLAGLASGKVAMVVGTHALLSEGVEFKDLALVVIDEGHRFGVAQRGELRRKGRSPHVLVMTATPIPRTIALTLYGDLDVSTIDEMPRGRPKIGTWLVGAEKRADAYEFIRERVRLGERVFIVYPLVSESDSSELGAAVEESRRLSREVFPDLAVGLIHGRMSPREKEAAMRRFRDGRTQILVSTVVVEVGIDVPEATVMVVEHAERFGLATLHQLRGRIGRGGQKAYCLLFPTAGAAVRARASGESARGGAQAGLIPELEVSTEDAARRLEVMTRTSDGFEIAEEDLRIRGPGEFFGTRQHGVPELRVADLIGDAETLKEARSDAFALVEAHPRLDGDRLAALRERVRTVFRGRLKLVEIG